MEYVDDSIQTFGDVELGQNFLHNGSRKVKIQNQNGTDNALVIESAVTMQIDNSDVVSEVSDTVVHSV